MVNLNHVLSGMHTISNNNWEVELIGGIQLKYGATEVAKKVRNARDWSQAFCIYSKAVLFIFPHRKEELEDYAEQVATLFVGNIESPDSYCISIVPYHTAVK